MKGIIIDQFGIENLKQSEIPLPGIEPDQVLVRVKAVALQFLDLIVVKGIVFPGLRLPHVPVSEGAGIVEKVGDKVTGWKKGDRVLIPFVQQWQSGKITAAINAVRTGLQTPGVLSEYVAVPANTLVRSPKNLTDEEAATLPVTGLTAWANLVTHAQIQAGQTVLIQGSGGVSLFALLIAKLFGVRIIATTSSDEKGEKLKKLGAHAVVNYTKNPEWSNEVKRLNNGTGVDITLDVGGQSTIMQSILSCKENGFVGLVGFLSGGEVSIQLAHVIMNYIRLQGNSVGSASQLEELVNAIEINNLKPVIETVYTMDQTKEAFRHLDGGKAFGKIIITV